VVITDLRLPDEAAIVKKVGGLIWHIDRPGLSSVDDHVTETALRGIPSDAIIVNDGSPERMLDRAVDALNARER